MHPTRALLLALSLAQGGPTAGRSSPAASGQLAVQPPPIQTGSLHPLSKFLQGPRLNLPFRYTWRGL